MNRHPRRALMLSAMMWATVLVACPSNGVTPQPPVPDASARSGDQSDASADDSTASGDNGGTGATAGRITRTLDLNGVSVEAIIEIPENDVADALVLYHGTVVEDDLVLQAAQDTLDGFRAILDRDDMLVVSVAYPEEGLLMGDNLVHAEAALLWVQQMANEELGVLVDKVFLAGHSQGGYLVTRLNTRHAVAAVFANAPGPLDLVFRCQLEEDGLVDAGVTCGQLAAAYGSTRQNPDAYAARSLLSFTSDHRSDIVFFQGLEDSPIQMRSWPLFKERMEACTTCRERRFVEVPELGHGALFASDDAQRVFNEVLRRPSEM
jgi:hypothetical protein